MLSWIRSASRATKAFQRPKKIFCSRQVRKTDNMKIISFFNTGIFIVNLIGALLLLLACLVPFISAEHFPYFSFLGLGLPLLVMGNLLFLLYWFLVNRKKAIFSSVTLVIAFFVFGTFVPFRFSKESIRHEDLKVMSFNVRGFNRLGRIKSPNTYIETLDFIAQEDPDIICFQEMDYSKRGDFRKYPYQFVKFKDIGQRSILGIFSKYPIVGQGMLNWPDTANNGSYVDILYKRDTVRIYNLHMESFKYHPKTRSISGELSPSLFKNLNPVFKKQAEQAKLFLKHREDVSFKTIICVDLNNTQFANTYHMIKGDMQDSFIEKGFGLGRTYKSLGLPFRIDFIMADQAFEVRGHKNYNVRFSDHFPVMASFRLQGQ
ncbi:MAG: endonuclease [Flavobacteriales bacterium]|nr:MAG: endonuclease [Flavobacteriales bacterium]